MLEPTLDAIGDAGLLADTDRLARHRHAALCLATVVLIIGRLIDWRDRSSPP